MAIYRTLWMQAVLLVAVSGLAVAVIALPVGNLVAAGVGGFLAVVLVRGVIYTQVRERGVTAPRIGSLCVSGVIGGVGCTVAAGLTVALSGLALLLILALGGCSPAPLRRRAIRSLQTTLGYRRAAGVITRAQPEEERISDRAASPTEETMRPMSPSDRTLSTLPSSATCALLTDMQVCWWWRASYLKLQESMEPTQRLLVIETRRVLLDQLADRNPHGFAQWLNSGARAASDPSRYFTGTQRLGN